MAVRSACNPTWALAATFGFSFAIVIFFIEGNNNGYLRLRNRSLLIKGNLTLNIFKAYGPATFAY